MYMFIKVTPVKQRSYSGRVLLSFMAIGVLPNEGSKITFKATINNDNNRAVKQ